MKRWLWLLLPMMAACSPRAAPRPDLHAMPTASIEGHVRWEGDITVDRIVVVRAGGHLEIAPGTRVRFRRIDWDGDGIGDAEITVEGRLTAVGTPEAPLDLASDEPAPRPGDWKYIMVNFASGAEIAFARIRHAFSGIQVHYSRAVVRNCVFSDNVDGVRFSTADLRVEGCWIVRNTHGIRFEERGHPAVVVGNEISNNDVGVFAVTRCSGRSVFRRNNIRGNRIAVKLGWEQEIGLPFPENYWGTADRSAVMAHVADGREHPKGPPVFPDPLLSSPVPVPPPLSP